MIVNEDGQPSLADMPFADMVYDKEHPLLKLSDAIHWENLTAGLSVFYSARQGRPTIALRAQAGTLMLKHIKNLSDREAVRYVQENIYAQRFCGLSPTQASNHMNAASGLTHFREQIGSGGMALIQEVLTCAAKGKRMARGDKLILDTTCVPLDIHYPTDIRLLERCRQALIGLMKEAKRMGMEVVYRTYSRMARKMFVTFSKLTKPKEKTRRRVHKQLFQFVRRNFKQLEEMREVAGRLLGPRCPTDPVIRRFLQKLKETEITVRTILHQQGLVRRGIVHIHDRIVSFHRTRVRPIVRGKVPVSCEFGPKILVGVVRGCVYVADAFWNNVADATLAIPGIRWFKTRFGRLPKECLGDRGFYAQWRVRCLTAIGIRVGFQERGKAVEKTATSRRMIRQRLCIEAFISLAKRKFGWDRCRARRPDHEISWIGLGAAALNVHRAFIARPP